MGIFKNNRDKPRLIFSCVHAPYHHRKALSFLEEVYKKYGCKEEVICVGDLYDFHAMSRFTSELDALPPDEEYRRAREFVKEMCKLFPKGILVLGNHDLIPQRQMKELSVSSSLLRDSNDLYGLGKGWRVEPLCYVIPEWDVLCEHGIGSEGVNGALTTAIYKRCSFVQGHSHAEAGVKYSANHSSLIFGLNVGCLCDNTSLAMRYGKYAKKKGVLGCGLVYSQTHAIFVPMNREYKKGTK